MGIFFEEAIKSEYCLDLILEHTEEIIEESGIGGVFGKIIKIIDAFIKKIKEKIQTKLIKSMVNKAMDYITDHPTQTVKFVDFEKFDRVMKKYVNDFSMSLDKISMGSCDPSKITEFRRKSKSLYTQVSDVMEKKTDVSLKKMGVYINTVIGSSNNYAIYMSETIRNRVEKASDKLNDTDLDNETLQEALAYISDTFSDVQRVLDYVTTVSIAMIKNLSQKLKNLLDDTSVGLEDLL